MKKNFKMAILSLATLLLFGNANAQIKKVPAKKVPTKSTVKKVSTTKLPAASTGKAVVSKTKVTGSANTLPSGIGYTIYPGNTKGPKANVSDMVTMHIKVKAGDSTMFDSYVLNDSKPVPAQITKPQYNGDIMESLTLLCAGDSAVFVVHQDSVMRNGQKPPFIKPSDKIMYNVKMVSIKSEAAFKAEQALETEKALAGENKIMDDYIASNNIKNVQRTASGLRYVITQAGSGENAKPGVKATMNYTGKFLDGKPFDSNILPEFGHVTPFEFALGQGQVIKGWDEGIALLNKGSKATLIIPSPLGYGSRDSGPIKANSILIFDVELVDFK
jgi:FKBP-type peptidyl-prolyl cis-trans isomerase FkpA